MEEDKREDIVEEAVQREEEEIPDSVKERINTAVKAMNDYKIKLINNATLKTQNPAVLNHVNTLLRKNSALTKNYIVTRRIPENSDEDFKAYILVLSKTLDPWNADVSTLTQAWCVKVFENGTFSGETSPFDLIMPV